MNVESVSVEAGREEGGGKAAGFSLIEVLIAAVVLLIIALGIIPLFTRSMIANSLGSDATQASNYGKTRVEELYQLPFNHQRLTVQPGQKSLQTPDSLTLGTADQIGDANEGWWPGTPTGKGVMAWARTTTTRQYSISDLNDGALVATEAKDGGTEPIFIHLKEVEVQMDSGRQNRLLGGNRALTVRVLKAF